MRPNKITEMAWIECRKYYPEECGVCHSKENLIVHHKNKNRLDNSKDNIGFLCRTHHSIHHNKKGDTGLKGKHHSYKSKEKISNGVIEFYKNHPENFKKSEEQAKKYGKHIKGKTYEEYYGKEKAEEIKQKQSEKSKINTKKQWANPILREKMIKGLNKRRGDITALCRKENKIPDRRCVVILAEFYISLLR